MAAPDLFTWIDALYTKAAPEGTPPVFMMHRFLASDPDLAQAARTIQVEIRDPALAFKLWQGLLPTGRGAPRFSYCAPKKAPTAEELTERMISVLGERRPVVEQMQELVRAAGRLLDLYHYFGVKPPAGEPVPASSATEKKARGKKAPTPPPGGGLLG